MDQSIEKDGQALENLFYREHLRKLRIEDILEKAEQIGIVIENGGVIEKIVYDLDRFLSKNDTYFEAYWQSVEEAIRANTEVKNES